MLDKSVLLPHIGTFVIRTDRWRDGWSAWDDDCWIEDEDCWIEDEDCWIE
jgi:hypothetical protein